MTTIKKPEMGSSGIPIRDIHFALQGKMEGSHPLLPIISQRMWSSGASHVSVSYVWHLLCLCLVCLF